MVKELIKLANHLDRIGYTKEANYIDALLRKKAEEAMFIGTGTARTVSQFLTQVVGKDIEATLDQSKSEKGIKSEFIFSSSLDDAAVEKLKSLSQAELDKYKAYGGALLVEKQEGDCPKFSYKGYKALISKDGAQHKLTVTPE